MGNRYTSDLPEGWKGTFLAALGAGTTIDQASEACGVSVPHLYKLRSRDDEFRAEWDAAKKLRTEKRRDWVLDKLHTIAEDDQDKRQFAALLKLYDNLPENKGREITLTGDPSKPLVVGHEARLTLAHVVGLAERLGLGSGASGELPAARNVLSEPEND